MHRRTVLVAAAIGGLSGCLSRVGDAPPESTASPTKQKDTETPVRRSVDGLTAAFRVVDGHEPTADAASATFGDGQVTVTGTMDPGGCNRPTLREVRYTVADGVVHLAVGTKSPYGPTATVECGNASYDYRCLLSVERGQVEAVEVVHDYGSKDVRSFTLTRA